jgi:NCAIR mutase (PurE)-related protein
MQALLESVRDGHVSVQEGLRQWNGDPVLDLGHSRLDLDRERRCGQPEVVFGEGKRPEQLVEIADALLRVHGRVLVTRVAHEGADALLRALPEAVHHELARCITVGLAPDEEGLGHVVVASAGTSDGPVAQEAALAARFMGARVSELADVGVAGLHRLLAERDTLQAACSLVVVAGMEGALPSVVGGLVSRPVIAVPTSIGYGASFGGIAALLAMLNSCAAGVSVVNIDNGFGAGYAAAMINERYWERVPAEGNPVQRPERAVCHE